MRVGNKLSVTITSFAKFSVRHDEERIYVEGSTLQTEAFHSRVKRQQGCLPVSALQSHHTLSGVLAPSPTSHTRTASGWAWLCPPERSSMDSPSCVGHGGLLPCPGVGWATWGSSWGTLPTPSQPRSDAGPCPASHPQPSGTPDFQVLAPSCGWSSQFCFSSFSGK